MIAGIGEVNRILPPERGLRHTLSFRSGGRKNPVYFTGLQNSKYTLSPHGEHSQGDGLGEASVTLDLNYSSPY